MGTRRVRKLNKTRRKYGGAKLGEGARALAYDIYSEGDESLYSITKNSTNKIELFFADGNSETITDKDKVDEFIESLKVSTESIAKIFKSPKMFSFKSSRTEFIGELDINRKVIDSYGLKNAIKYSTLTGIKIKGKNVSGAIFSGKKSIYAIFNVKCNGHYDMNIKQFTLDILESLVHLSGNHNDIKLDNVVECSDRYKLIDWDKFSDRDVIEFGSSATTNPIKYYVRTGHSIVASYFFFGNRLQKGRHFYDRGKIKQQNEYKEIEEIIKIEYNDVVKQFSLKEIREKFKDTYDVFAFGISLLYGVIHFKLDYQKYKPLIEKLTSLKDPLNAKEGLAFAKKFFKNQEV